MPDARSSFWNGATQGGSNCDNVLADAYVKGVRGEINWEDGLAAMLTDAEVVPPNNNDSRDPSGSTAEGRGALPDWLEYGYITPTFGRSVSRAVEYSVNDFAVYQVASGLELANASVYLNRSRNWRNHWNPEAESLGFYGFVVPRDTDGFIAQDPLTCGGCYWADYCKFSDPLPPFVYFSLHCSTKKAEMFQSHPLTHPSQRQTTKPSPGNTRGTPTTTSTPSSPTPAMKLPSSPASK